MEQIIEVKHLVKKYGDVEVLKDVNFTLHNGIYGLIGPNGAGKSTLIHILTTLSNATQGNITYNGKDIHLMKHDFYIKIGFMPQAQKGYDDFTGIQFLYYIACLKDIDKKIVDMRILTLIKQLGLEKDIHKKIKKYSGGMKQRLMFIQAMLDDPDILILDEPTAGLDPFERIRLRNLIAENASEKIILIATHVMQDIESIANNLIFLEKGSIIYQGDSMEILRSLQGIVCEKIIDVKDLPYYQEKYQISKMIKMSEQYLIRYIGEKGEGQVMANLEDAYLYYLKQ